MTLVPLLLILRPTTAEITTLCSAANSSCVISCTETHSCHAMDIDAPLSTTILFNCSGDHSCEHLNVIAFDIDDHNNDEHSNFTIVCAGENSCNDATFDISGEFALTLNCLHPNSCVDTSVTVRTSHNESTESWSDSDVQINFFDSCSEFLSIHCLDETAQCSLYCENKYVQIATEAFRVTTFDDAGSCFEQQFTHSCPAEEDALDPTRAHCPTNHGVHTTMTTETIWTVRKRVDANLSNYCPQSLYHGEFEKRITTIQPSYDMAQNEDRGVRNMSVIVAIGCLCVMLSIFWAITVELCRYANRIYHKKFISARPPMYCLWGPFLCDVLIFIAFYWWLVKGVVFESTANAYCTTNYPVDEFSQFRVTCDNDDICELDKDDGAYECTSAFTEVYVWRWVVVSVFFVVELCRLFFCCAADHTSEWDYYCCVPENSAKPDVDPMGFGAQCLCWKLLCHNSWCNHEEYDKFIAQVFWKRRMWTSRHESPGLSRKLNEKRRAGDWQCWFCDMSFRYGVHIAFACVYYAKFSPLLPDSDAALTWYDVWPAIALVVLKFWLQQCYYGNLPYDPEEENPHEIREILVDRLEHTSLAAVVESYLPLYHNSGKCPAELLTREVQGFQDEDLTQRRTSQKTKGAYEQLN